MKPLSVLSCIDCNEGLSEKDLKEYMYMGGTMVPSVLSSAGPDDREGICQPCLNTRVDIDSFGVEDFTTEFCGGEEFPTVRRVK